MKIWKWRLNNFVQQQVKRNGRINTEEFWGEGEAWTNSRYYRPNHQLSYSLISSNHPFSETYLVMFTAIIQFSWMIHFGNMFCWKMFCWCVCDKETSVILLKLVEIVAKRHDFPNRCGNALILMVTLIIAPELIDTPQWSFVLEWMYDVRIRLSTCTEMLPIRGDWNNKITGSFIASANYVSEYNPLIVNAVTHWLCWKWIYGDGFKP